MNKKGLKSELEERTRVLAEVADALEGASSQEYFDTHVEGVLASKREGVSHALVGNSAKAS